MSITERLAKARDFLNPASAIGGIAGRVAIPLLLTGIIASQTVPGTPFNLAGLSELGGGATEPGAELVLGVDLSFSSTTQKWWRDRYDDGVRIGATALWTGLQSPSPACPNLRYMEAAGVAPVGYLSLSDAYWGAQNVNFGYNACPDMWPRLLFVVIDIELPITNPQAQIEEAIARVRELGQLPVIYTSWGAWNRYVGGWTPDVPLWNALWDGEPDVDYLGLPFGFTVLVGEQYRGGGDWHGVNVDLNVFDKRLLYQPPPPEPIVTPAPTPQPPVAYIDGPLIKLAGEDAIYFVAGGLKIWIPNPEVFALSGYDWSRVEVVTENDPRWKLPTFGAGTP